MSSLRFAIEYRTKEGQRHRVVYYADMDGLRWFRREDVSEGEQWRRGPPERIATPAFTVRPITGGSFEGP